MNVGGRKFAEGVFATFQCFLSHLTSIMKNINFYVNCHFQLPFDFLSTVIGFCVGSRKKIEAKKYGEFLTLACNLALRWIFFGDFPPRSICFRDNSSHLLPRLTPSHCLIFLFICANKRPEKNHRR